MGVRRSSVDREIPVQKAVMFVLPQQGYGAISAVLRNDVVRSRAIIIGSDAWSVSAAEICLFK